MIVIYIAGTIVHIWNTCIYIYNRLVRAHVSVWLEKSTCCWTRTG